MHRSYTKIRPKRSAWSRHGKHKGRWFADWLQRKLRLKRPVPKMVDASKIGTLWNRKARKSAWL